MALRSMTRLLVPAVLLIGGFAATASAETKVTIVNNLEQPLVFKEISNRQNVNFVTKPPQTISAHSSGSFKVKVGSSGGNDHMNIKYSIQDTDDQVGVVYKYEKITGGSKHCPKEHPDWVTETVEHCGNWDGNNWTYTYSEK